MKYAQDCEMLFGRFIHHFPYLGLRGESDQQNWQIAVEQTQVLFQDHFGEDAIKFVKPADCQPLGSATDRQYHSRLRGLVDKTVKNKHKCLGIRETRLRFMPEV